MKLFALIVCAGAITAPAFADTIDLKWTGTGAGVNAKIDFGGNTLDVFMGQLQHDFSNGTGAAAAFNGSHLTYCPDLYQYVTGDGATYDLKDVPHLPVSGAAPVMGAGKAQAIYDIFGAFGATATAIGADNNFGAAFQAAVWEIVYDYDSGVGLASIDLASGNVKIHNADGDPLAADVVNDFNAILGAIGTTRGLPILGVGHNDFQDQLFLPAPGSLALAATGLGLLGRRRR